MKNLNKMNPLVQNGKAAEMYQSAVEMDFSKMAKLIPLLVEVNQPDWHQGEVARRMGQSSPVRFRGKSAPGKVLTGFTP